MCPHRFLHHRDRTVKIIYLKILYKDLYSSRMTSEIVLLKLFAESITHPHLINELSVLNFTVTDAAFNLRESTESGRRFFSLLLRYN